MILVFLDDTGTHDDSPFTGWGGIIGEKENIDNLNARWRERLKAPCEGKQPLDAFHAVHLAHSKGEFDGYKPPQERDRTQCLFREEIIASGVGVFGSAIDRRAWRRIMAPGAVRPVDDKSGQLAFAFCLKLIANHTSQNRDTIHVCTDAGQKQDVRAGSKAFSKLYPHLKEHLRYFSGPCNSSPLLQAADLVAYEMWCLIKDWDGEGPPGLRPQMKHLFDGVESLYFQMMREAEIVEMKSRLDNQH